MCSIPRLSLDRAYVTSSLASSMEGTFPRIAVVCPVERPLSWEKNPQNFLSIYYLYVQCRPERRMNHKRCVPHF